MGQYTIKEAARITRISATTIRRYIKAGKLVATLSKGRYGMEYRISPDDLKSIGLELNPNLPSRKANHEAMSLKEINDWVQDVVPISLYQELALKHEQLLVQYGMIRAGGKRLMEMKAESELKDHIIEEKKTEIRELIDRHKSEMEFLKKHLRKAELEIEEKNHQIRELRDKLSLMELLSRNAITTESIEKQFMEIHSRQEKIRSFVKKREKSFLKDSHKEHSLEQKSDLDH